MKLDQGKRTWLGFALAFALVLSASPARAGSYMDRLALLVGKAAEDSEYLRARLSDRELARVVQAMAEARVKAAGAMTVPKEVAQAHPHVLLVLENHERAAQAAKEGNAQRFLIYHQRARDEERVLRGVLKQLGFPLPNK
jgi:hypothetical protein